ncbi:MAG: MerC domain-containing protein [Rubricoccaceae bacterium]
MLWDRLGLGLSLLCLVHCLALPFALLGLSASLAWLAHDQVHLWLALVVVPVAALALWQGVHRHGDRLSATLIAGGALMVVGALGAEALMGHAAAKAMTVAGGLLLAGGHLRNARCAHPRGLRGHRATGNRRGQRPYARGASPEVRSLSLPAESAGASRAG